MTQSALADLLGIESFIPVGYSMGGPVAQLLWRNHRERVSGLVLCATARNFRGKPQERLFFMLMPAIAMGLALRKPSNETADALAKRLLDWPADANLDDLDVPSWALKEFRRTSPVDDAPGRQRHRPVQLPWLGRGYRRAHRRRRHH